MPTTQTYTYSVASLHVDSVVPLPAVPVSRVTDVTITVRTGTVPPFLPHPTVSRSWWQAAPGRILLQGTPRILIRDGHDITIQAYDSELNEIAYSFLIGPAFGGVMHQRSLLPLHASALGIAGGCIAFMGEKGMGKSTLAGFVHAAGFPLLCDDLCVVVHGTGAATVSPVFPAIKLRPDAAEALAPQLPTLALSDYHTERFTVPPPVTLSTEPRPLKALYVLVDAKDTGEAGFQRLAPKSALDFLMRNVYGRPYAAANGTIGTVLNQCVTLAQQVPVFLCQRTHGLENKRAQVETLIRHWSAL